MNMRRFNDVVIAILLLLICLPALVLSCVALWIEQSAFPLARVERVTREGRIVRLYRFRTMRQTDFGERPTVVGEVLRGLHVDKIHQLLNVLNGELSLTGNGPAPDHGIRTKNLLALREP